MKRITGLGFLCAALFLMLGVPGASADTLTYTGTSGANTHGYYVYQYYVSVNGHTPQAMICVDFYDNVNAGQTWLATPFSAKQADTNWGAFVGTKFEAAAYLFHVGLTNPGEIGDVQWALWDLFDPGTAAAHGANTANEQALLAQALGLSPAQLDEFSNYLVWVPDAFNGTNWGQLGGQVFMTPVPEPGTLFLLGSGLLGLAMLVYFRKRVSGRPPMPTW